MTQIDTIAKLLLGAKHVAFLTGAGVSAESGIPTFRDALEGYWSKYDPEQLATPQAFAADPELVSRWYDERRQKVLACQPNAGHVALAELERLLTERGATFAILTQNVDGLHRRAGSKEVIEVHGSLLRWRSTTSQIEYDDLPVPFESYPVPAPDGGLLRPGVVWFGEALPDDALARVDEELARCDVFVSVGTSGLVYPAAGWSLLAKRAGAKTVEINRDPTPMSQSFDHCVLGQSGTVLPAIVEAIRRG
ncbi:MAG: NAD-dependent deacylase [bacterium]